jgi:hypothetical protein
MAPHLSPGPLQDPTPRQIACFHTEVVRAKRGDIVCFTDRTPHRSLSNRSGRMRRSMDLRYEVADLIRPYTEQRGFTAHRPDRSKPEISYNTWRKKWAAPHRPKVTSGILTLESTPMVDGNVTPLRSRSELEIEEERPAQGKVLEPGTKAAGTHMAVPLP